MVQVVVARRCPRRLEKKRKIRREKKRKKENKRKEELKKELKKELEKKRFHENLKKYWDRVWESDGFDIDGLRSPSYREGMEAFKCEKLDDCPLLVRLYAKMGLHRYNMLQGTNLQLHSIERYNREGIIATRPYTYYITLVAKDPSTGSFVTFQTSSRQRSRSQLNVGVYVARPQITGTIGEPENAPQFYNISVPQWPSENDTKHFYLVQESELKENVDWIRLYLEVGFVITNRRIRNPKMSDLKIVEVMVETEENSQPPNERLKGFIDATFYIKFDQDLGEGQVCNRRAIIRRSVDLRTERMHLIGDYHPESKT